MAITAFSGPLMIWGQVPQSGLEYNPDFGASLFNGGAGIMDPRLLYTYQPGEAQYEPDFGWLGFDNVTTLSAVPYTAATSIGQSD